MFGKDYIFNPYTVCPRSSDPFYIVIYYVKWVTTSWTYSIQPEVCRKSSINSQLML